MKKPKHYSLYSKCQSKKTKDFVDFDYIDKLSDEEKEFLAKFSSEYYEASFTDQNLHSDEQKKEIYRANNARNRDITAKFIQVAPTDIPASDPTPAINNAIDSPKKIIRKKSKS